LFFWFAANSLVPLLKEEGWREATGWLPSRTLGFIEAAVGTGRIERTQFHPSKKSEQLFFYPDPASVYPPFSRVKKLK
jgi:hypothetical protein